MECKFKRAKKAGITIEVAVTTVLSVTVLFMALGLFNQNINVMAANGNFSNLFNRKNVTAQSFTNKDYQNSQIDVRIVADQGLQGYHKRALDTINKYANQTTPLTDAQKIDLARALTIYAESDAKLNSNDALSATMPGSTKSFREFGAAENNGKITIDYYVQYLTTVNINNSKITIPWSNQNERANPSSDEKTARIPNVMFINSAFDAASSAHS